MKLIDHPIISIQNDLLQTQNNTAVKSQRQKENRKGSRTEDRDLQRKPQRLSQQKIMGQEGAGRCIQSAERKNTN